MISRKKQGFGAYEMLTICVMLLIIIVVALAYVFRTDYKEKYQVMEYNARMLALSVSNLYLEDSQKSTYYLQNLVDAKIYSNIKNPFQGDTYCDSNKSKVEIKENKKYVTLECGNYLIYNQNSLEKNYTIYQVSNWSLKKHEIDNQRVEFYNYQQDGEKLFAEDLEEELFLYEFNKIEGTEYEDVSAIPQQENIIKNTMYRYMKKVSD